MGNETGIADWYKNNLTLLNKFATASESMLKNLLEENRIVYLGVNARVKTLDSLLKKVSKKGYSDPINEIFDFVAVRIITFLESDVRRVNRIIEENFILDTNHSSNKSNALGLDRVGYRSWHYVCSLDHSRQNPPQFQRFRQLKLEIQVRTALQHAWAEIEHDRRYKLSGQLPDQDSRRLNLLAANLELLDAQFSELAEKIDEYSKEIDKQTRIGNFSASIDSISVMSYIESLEAKYPFIEVSSEYSIANAGLIKEMSLMGIEHLSDLNTYFNKEFMDFYKRHINTFKGQGGLTAHGLIRDAMIFHDIDRYFENAWQSKWKWMDSDEYGIWVDRHGKEKVDNILKKFDLMLVDNTNQEIYELPD